VTTGAGCLQDAEDCLRDWAASARGDEAFSATATVVIAKLNELLGQGIAKPNILIRGHSLGALDGFRVLEKDLAGNGILLGVPLHAILHLNRHLHLPTHLRRQNPFPISKVGFFVSPTDPIARGFPTPNYFGSYTDVWCRTKKGIAPLFNTPPPENITLNVVDTASDGFINGHFIGSYCAVAPVTCFRDVAPTTCFP
jgi:hypothetical protein